jgi:hypothetical protein
LILCHNWSCCDLFLVKVSGKIYLFIFVCSPDPIIAQAAIMLLHDHHNKTHGVGVNHPCVAPAIWGSVLTTLILTGMVLGVGYWCRVHSVMRKQKKEGVTEEEACHEYEEFWFPRLESGNNEDVEVVFDDLAL